ncbi:hypothetical protein JCM33374_g4757 [Metschnikowia sp. JCM 33374]|nr:hypothetical protein JCM33374_g4757 [Metschnikowia sp. JCM 33374]
MTISRATQPAFSIKNGVRSVSPYYHEYRTPFKARWQGQSAPAILSKELGQTEAAIKCGIDSGRIYVTANNGRSGGPVVISGSDVYTHGLQGHDIIHNLQHCHEPNIRICSDESKASVLGTSAQGPGPVVLSSLSNVINGFSQIRSTNETVLSKHTAEYNNTGEEQRCSRSSSGIDLLYEDETLVVVNKPGGIPSHPGGIYRHNTMSEILGHDLRGPVWPCHRLDKSTSGVMVFAKSRATSTEYMKLFSAKTHVEKWYVARVKGRFPYKAISYTCPVFSVNTAGNAYINVSNQAQVPTNSTTDFYNLYHCPDNLHSIVLCRPITGRMHQIRVHLRNLGFPIGNDQLYNGEHQLNRKKNDVELQIYHEIWKSFPGYGVPGPDSSAGSGPSTSTNATAAPQPGGPSQVHYTQQEYPSTICIQEFLTENIKSQMNTLSLSRVEKDSRAISGTCGECSRPLYAENIDPDSGIWLHALALRWRRAEPGLYSTVGSVVVAAPCPPWCA